MSAPRRRDDDDAFDARRLRGPSLDSQTKWVVGVVSTTVMALALWGLQADRASVESRLGNLDQRVIATEQLTRAIVAGQSAQQATADARWEEVKRSLERIERDTAMLKSREMRR